ncbi:MAG: DUF2185 domain-containing protein [Clostridia bacterium]|nr:DUF2185 domain-containing protein [Clostridia bacterium]
MNRLLNEITKIAKDGINKYLLKVSMNQLEGNGKIYYMNDKDGTAFDWYVNKRLCPFMCFYDDAANMGAVKIVVSDNCCVDAYFYENGVNKPTQTQSYVLDCVTEDIFELAVILNKVADDNGMYGAAIDDMDTDVMPSEEEVNQFKECEKSYNEIRKYKNEYSEIMEKTAIISNKILEDGWKVSYFYRDEPSNDVDSGWCFMAGNETQEYADDASNFKIIYISSLLDIDSSIIDYVLKPIGTKMIRIGHNEFELDDGIKEIYTEKQ